MTAAERAIVAALRDGSIRTVRELAEDTGLAVGTVRVHVRCLLRSGWVIRHGGPAFAYSLPYPPVKLPPQAENAETFIRAALAKLLDGKDPLPELSAAMAVLLIEENVQEPADLDGLQGWAESIREGKPWL